MKAAIILAAGKGSRLGGVCKAALRREDGQTFVDAVCGTARAAGCDRVVVVAAEPHLEEARSVSAGHCDELVVNPAPERGMASSIAVGLAALMDAEVALVWPVDHAWVSACTVEAILTTSSRDTIVVPTYQGRGGHPTAFGARFFADIHASVDRIGGVRNLLWGTGIVRLPVGDGGVTKDWDTPHSKEL